MHHPRNNAPAASPGRPMSSILENYYRDAVWKGGRLMVCGRLVATIIPDATWPKMWRVQLPNGHFTDMVNISRAKDAALTLGAEALRES
jgi:hypothetical protein